MIINVTAAVCGDVTDECGCSLLLPQATQSLRILTQVFKRLESYIMYRLASSVVILGFFFLSIIALGFSFPTWVSE